MVQRPIPKKMNCPDWMRNPTNIIGGAVEKSNPTNIIGGAVEKRHGNKFYAGEVTEVEEDGANGDAIWRAFYFICSMMTGTLQTTMGSSSQKYCA